MQDRDVFTTGSPELQKKHGKLLLPPDFPLHVKEVPNFPSYSALVVYVTDQGAALDQILHFTNRHACYQLDKLMLVLLFTLYYC